MAAQRRWCLKKEGQQEPRAAFVSLTIRRHLRVEGQLSVVELEAVYIVFRSLCRLGGHLCVLISLGSLDTMFSNHLHL